MRSKKTGFTIIDVVIGFALLTLIVSFTVPIMMSSFINLRRGREITNGIFEGAQYLQDEIVKLKKEIVKKELTNEQIQLTPPTLTKETIKLFTGQNETPVEVYVVKLPGDNKAKKDLNRDYTVYVSSKTLEDLPIVKVQSVENYIQGITTTDKYQKKVNYYKNTLVLKGKMTIDTINSKAVSAGVDKEKRYWQIAPDNFIIPIYTDFMDTTKYEESLIGKAFPAPRENTIQEVSPIPTDQLLVSSDSYANKVIYYSVRTLSEDGKLGVYEWPKGNLYGGGIYLLKYPTATIPSIHLEANFITPDNYEQSNDSFIIKNVNKPITNNIAYDVGTIGLTTELSGKIKIGSSSATDVWTRAFSFDGITNSYIQDDLMGVSDMTVFIVAKLKDEPSNNIPIVSFENSDLDYRFRLTSSGVYLKNGLEQNITLETQANKAKYAVYTVKISKDGNASVQLNNNAEQILTTTLGVIQPYDGKIRLGSFMNNSYGNVNIAQIMIYKDDHMTQVGSVDSSKIIDELMKKYGI